MKLNKDEINAIRDLLSDSKVRSSDVLNNLYEKMTDSGIIKLYVDGAADLHSKTSGIGGVFIEMMKNFIHFRNI